MSFHESAAELVRPPRSAHIGNLGANEGGSVARKAPGDEMETDDRRGEYPMSLLEPATRPTPNENRRGSQYGTTRFLGVEAPAASPGANSVSAGS
jgi:hypothetical protein